jgi:hypothetical protein
MLFRSIHLLVFLETVAGMMYDVVDPHKLAPSECGSRGCARWSHLVEDGAVLPQMQTLWLKSNFTDGKMYNSSQATVDALWSTGTPPAALLPKGNECANPAKTSLVAWPPYPREAPGTDSAWCFCSKPGTARAWGDCRSAPSVPEQVNVVLGQDGSVVLSFVTLWEPTFPADLQKHLNPAPPRAQYTITGSTSPRSGTSTGTSTAATKNNTSRASASASTGNDTASSNVTIVTGVTHLYRSPHNLTDPSQNRYWNLTGRNYSFHFIKLAGLPEGATVKYKVASGAQPPTWSDEFTFAAPFGHTHTKYVRSFFSLFKKKKNP